MMGSSSGMVSCLDIREWALLMLCLIISVPRSRWGAAVVLHRPTAPTACTTRSLKATVQQLYTRKLTAAFTVSSRWLRLHRKDDLF